MLEFKNVSFAYDDGNKIIDNISFKVKKGDFIGLIGKSGCGKSTIFRLLLGFEKPTSGEIILRKGEKIGFMPQKDMLFPWRTIEENLRLPLEVQGKKNKESKVKVDEILEEMELTSTAKKYPSELSGGMRQRIAFARTCLTGANLLLLDEPFSALDYFTRMDFQDWIISQYMRLDKTILFITHSVDEAILLSNKIFLFEKGKPVTEIKEIEVEDKYPRSQEILGRKDIIDLKFKLIDELKTKNLIMEEDVSKVEKKIEKRKQKSMLRKGDIGNAGNIEDKKRGQN